MRRLLKHQLRFAQLLDASKGLIKMSHFNQILVLDEILSYISEEIGNPQGALRIVEKILDDVEGLRIFPNMGAPLSSVAAVESAYRFLVSGQYMIFYQTAEGKVYVDRILYGRRDYLRILFGETRKE